MGGWRKRGIMNNYRQLLMEGFDKRGIPERFAEQIFKQIAGFGEYGFPESHAASFALIAYVSAWLKRFHPATLTAALINSQPMGFYTPSQLIKDARDHGVPVLPVDINASHWDCFLIRNNQRSQHPKHRLRLPPEHWGLEGPAIRLGFRLVRGLAERHGRAIEEERLQGALFTDLNDLQARLSLPQKALTALAKADVFAGLGQPRRHALWQALCGSKAISSLPFPRPEQSIALPRATEAEDIYTDLRQLGLTLRRHPLALLRVTLGQLGASSAKELGEARHGQRLKVAGLVVLRQKPSTANGVLFMTLEDEEGSMNLIVPPFAVEKYHRVIRQSLLLMAEGRVERQERLVHLLVRHLEALPDSLTPFPVRSRNFR
jgi:error-prone DNA polymerase